MPEPPPSATDAGPPSPSPSPRPNGRSNPYVGPRALGPGEPIYGRERELLDLRDLLIAERIVLLYSPSGAGKTSLIQAGLIPEMEREEFAVLPIMRVGKNSTGTAGNRYLASAILSLEETLRAGASSSSAETAASASILPQEDVSAGEVAGLSFADYLEMRKDVLPPGDSKLLIFDQFEEILTVDPLDQEAKAEFFAQVGAVLRNSSRWALFSIREDYVAALDPYTRVVPTRLKSNLRLDLLTPEAARLAIEKPAENQGVMFTPEATSRLIDDLRRVTVQSRGGNFEARLGPYVEPVHLQVVCSQLWEKPRSNPSQIGVDELATIGDVDSALGEYYAAHVGNVARETGVKEKAIREWFDRSLITESGIRSEVMWQPGGSEGLNNAAIDALEAAHLVRKEERRDATWLELSHNRLVTPIRANNARWFEGNLSLLQQQSVLWHRQNRNDALCLRGQALIEARQWAEQHSDELTDTDREFLKESGEKESLRATKLLRTRIAVLSAVLIALALLTTVAIIQWIEATKQRNLAREHSTRAHARLLASDAQHLLEERLDLAIILGREASRKADLADVRGSALAAVLANPRLVSYLHGHQVPIETMAFVPGSPELLAVGDWKNRIVFWNVKTHRPVRVLDDLIKGVVRSIAFSPDKKYMAAASNKGDIIRYDLESGKIVSFPTGPEPQNVWSVTFSPDSKSLASADSAGQIIIWDIETQARVVAARTEPQPTGKPYWARTVGFDASGSLLAFGTDDGNVTILRKSDTTWTPVDHFAGSTAPEEEKSRRGRAITRLAFSPNDSNLLAIASKDWNVTLRDVAGKRYVARGEHKQSVSSLAFSKEGILVTGGWDNNLRLWEVPAAKDYNVTAGGQDQAPPGMPMRALTPIGPPLTAHVGSIFAVAFSSDGAFVASGGRDREVILWDPKCYLPNVATIETKPTEFAIAISPDGKHEVTGYPNGDIYSREVGGKPPNDLTYPARHTTKVVSVAFNRDGRFLISASNDTKESKDIKGTATVIVTEMASPKNAAATFRIEGNIVFAALSPDGKKAAITLTNGQIALLDVASGTPVNPPLSAPQKKQPDTVFLTAVFSPDGKRLAAAGENETACIWDLATGASYTTGEVHTGKIWALDFSPDGKLLASGSGDTTVLLWDAATGKAVSHPLTGHRHTVRSLAFSRDGSMLASGSLDMSVILWDVASRRKMGLSLARNLDSVRSLAFSADNKLYSSSYYGDTVEWDLAPSSLEARSQDRANHNLTRLEWEVYMEGPYRKTWGNLPDGDAEVAVQP